MFAISYFTQENYIDMLKPHSVPSVHARLDTAGQRQAPQPRHGLQRHPHNPERSAWRRRGVRVHRLQHVRHGWGHCRPLCRRFVTGIALLFIVLLRSLKLHLSVYPPVHDSCMFSLLSSLLLLFRFFFVVVVAGSLSYFSLILLDQCSSRIDLDLLLRLDPYFCLCVCLLIELLQLSLVAWH